MTPSRWLLTLALLTPLALAACGDDEPAPAPETWAPLHYDYLNKLRLNVGSVDVQDHSAPQGDSDVAAQSPTPPAQALAQMARDRLFAAGLTGHADFIIDQASITRDSNGTLTGTLSAHLDVFDTAGNRIGYAQAQVSRQHIPGSDPENLRNVLYDMTRQMMDSMNVEIEYQLKKSLRGILVTGDAVPAAVTATPLQPASPAPAPPQSTIPGVDLGPPQEAPGQAAPVMPAPQPALPPGEPSPPDETAPPPEQMSPPPGYLQLPAATPQPQY
jgi:hypothetical protein